MGSFSLFHWIIVFLLVLVVAVPFYRIFKRTGVPPFLAVFAVVPFVSIVFLWVVAFKPWPNDPAPPAA